MSHLGYSSWSSLNNFRYNNICKQNWRDFLCVLRHKRRFKSNTYHSKYHINQQFLPQFYGSKVWVVNLDMLIGQIDSAHFFVVYINNIWDPLFYTSAVLCCFKTCQNINMFQIHEIYWVLKVHWILDLINRLLSFLF